LAGFPKSFRIFPHGNGRKRSAIIVNKIDAIAIRQVSDQDATLIELSYSGLNFYGASLYVKLKDIESLEKIIHLTKGKGLLLSIDSNSRSKLWYDRITNQRGKFLEDFIITRDLLLMNVKTSIPTFETIRGRSWIDPTL
jgi:sugar/nucleoside kinase (ribokinase family)